MTREFWGPDFDELRATDPEIAEVVVDELDRLRSGLQLIASENFTSPAVLAALGSTLSNKYAEGYPGRRYYGGCEVVDRAEEIGILRAKELFGAEHANLQPHSGASANLAVYGALLSPGDTVLAMSLPHGGHLTHGSKVNFSGKWFDVVAYGVRQDTELIDYDEVADLARQHRPKMIICGATAYSRLIDFARFRAIADEVGAYLMVDAAHFIGLVAGQAIPSPVPHAHVVTFTTHKVLRGPRGGMFVSTAELGPKLDKAVFPMMQGGPLMHGVAAKAVALKEAATPEYQRYAQQVVTNARALADGLSAEGVRIVAGGTDTHLFLADLRELGVTGSEAEVRCGEAGIVLNKNAIPFDPQPPAVGSGVRIGSPAVTTQGMTDVEMKEVASLVARAIRGDDAAQIREGVKALVEAHPAYRREAVREYSLVFCVAAAVTYLFTPVARRVALVTKTLAQPRDRDVHAIATPYMGGLAMYAGLVASMLVARKLPLLGSVFEASSEPKALLIAGGTICVVGLVDDRWGLDALTKLAGQAMAAGLMVMLGLQLLYAPWPGGTVSLSQELAVLATVGLALLMVNSINFIDGLDGLASGVVAIAAGAFFVFSYQFSVELEVDRARPATLISAILAGVCVGFLPHNFHPARIFMGDSGSMLIGLMLAAATTSGVGGVAFDQAGGAEQIAFFIPLLVPLVVLAVPFVDLLLAVVRRLRAGRPVFTPDKEHLHHRLLEIGHSHRRAVLIIYFWSALIAFGGVAVSFSRPVVVVAVVTALAVLAVVAMALPRLRRAGEEARIS